LFTIATKLYVAAQICHITGLTHLYHMRDDRHRVMMLDKLDMQVNATQKSIRRQLYIKTLLLHLMCSVHWLLT